MCQKGGRYAYPLVLKLSFRSQYSCSLSYSFLEIPIFSFLLNQYFSVFFFEKKITSFSWALKSCKSPTVLRDNIMSVVWCVSVNCTNMTISCLATGSTSVPWAGRTSTSQVVCEIAVAHKCYKNNFSGFSHGFHFSCINHANAGKLNRSQKLKIYTPLGYLIETKGFFLGFRILKSQLTNQVYFHHGEKNTQH